MRMGKMGPNAKKREYRRHDLMAYLLSVDSTSYQGIREKLNVTDKTIRDDLAYLQDVKGIVLECQAGVGGYVRISDEWRKRKCPMTLEQERAVLVAYQNASDLDLKNTYLSILADYCSPAFYEHEI